MEQNKDILTRGDFRQRPYQVPSDYFEGLQSRLMTIPQENPLPVQKSGRVIGLWQRMRPYAAMAASFALVLAVGSVVLRRPAAEPDDWAYESLLYADMIPHVDPYSIYGDYQDEAEPSSEELLDFLVFSNFQPDFQDLTDE